jgi:S1-C subfamily serine protease
MDRIIVSSREVAEIGSLAADAAPVAPKLPPPIHWGLRAALSPLVLVLPLLCLLSIVIRVAFRNQSPRIRHAWTAFLSTLLIVSGLLSCAAVVVVFSLGPLPAMLSASAGSADLDERSQFPVLPSETAMDPMTISQELKPLVVVVSPAQKNWFNRGLMASNAFGAGMLLHADAEGYLLATARHVVNGLMSKGDSQRVLVATVTGLWSEAEVVARHENLDLVLLWVPRRSGHTAFTQPIARSQDGESIFVIGHPEGLKFTLSNGIVSRLDGDTVQISAPVSPGNSGGPVYDARGNLIAIVIAKMDRTRDPNAENLNFAITAQALADASGWKFSGNGREVFDRFQQAVRALSAPAQK